VRKDALTYATSFGFFQSFMLTIAGYCLGSRLRGIGDKSEKVGGLILIGIGVKILMEHTLG
jgi:putative Mn2+ efflux pump MntP